MPNIKDYTIYKDNDLTISQIKSVIARTTAAANSRLNQLEKYGATGGLTYLKAIEYLRSQGRTTDRFSRSIKRSDSELRSEFNAMVDFLTGAGSTLREEREIGTVLKRLRKGNINGVEKLTPEEMRDVITFLQSYTYRFNIKKWYDSEQVIEEAVEKIESGVDVNDLLSEWNKFLEGEQ